MNQAFLSRGILRQAVKPMVSIDWMVFKGMVEPTDEIFEDPAVVAVRNIGASFMQLPYHMLNVETPADTYYEFNGTGECVDIISSSAEELIEHAHECVDFLKVNDQIRPDKQRPFEIDADSNLVRNHFACFNENCELPEAPEYNKCWKPENNAGCGCQAQTSTETETSGITVVQQSWIICPRSPIMIRGVKPSLGTKFFIKKLHAMEYPTRIDYFNVSVSYK